jgi:hypothetical protein
MVFASRFLDRKHKSCLFLASFSLAALIFMLAGCGTSAGIQGSSGGGPVPGESTQAAVLLSSTANDQLSRFAMTIDSVTLTSKSGTTVTLFNTPQYVEFMGLNGILQPLVTATVPQDVYTSATVNYSGSEFICVSYNPSSGIYVNGFGGSYSANPASVTLPSPVIVSGKAMSLTFNLAVSQSMTLSGCQLSAQYTIAPMFNLTASAILAQNKETGINGQISSTNTSWNNFNLTTNDGSVNSAWGTGSPLPLNTGSGTNYQGIAGFSALTPGMFGDIDTSIQPDGSLMATRIDVGDPTAENISIGPLLAIYLADGQLATLGREQQGDQLSTQPPDFDYYAFDANTVFKTSGQFSSLSSLPFTASFTAATMAAGQNVSLASGALSQSGSVRTLATTITLMPQTIDGTISAVSSSGGYTAYTVILAPYDMIPVLNGATSVVVYVNSDTRLLTSAPIAVGSTTRFNGLLFNDNGTLRMACAQVNDGVAL